MSRCDICQERRETRQITVGDVILNVCFACYERDGEAITNRAEWVIGLAQFVRDQRAQERTDRHYEADPSGEALMAEGYGSMAEMIDDLACDPDVESTPGNSTRLSDNGWLKRGRCHKESRHASGQQG